MDGATAAPGPTSAQRPRSRRSGASRLPRRLPRRPDGHRPPPPSLGPAPVLGHGRGTPGWSRGALLAPCTRRDGLPRTAVTTGHPRTFLPSPSAGRGHRGGGGSATSPGHGRHPAAPSRLHRGRGAGTSLGRLRPPQARGWGGGIPRSLLALTWGLRPVSARRLQPGSLSAAPRPRRAPALIEGQRRRPRAPAAHFRPRRRRSRRARLPASARPPARRSRGADGPISFGGGRQRREGRGPPCEGPSPQCSS